MQRDHAQFDADCTAVGGRVSSCNGCVATPDNRTSRYRWTPTERWTTTNPTSTSKTARQTCRTPSWTRRRGRSGPFCPCFLPTPGLYNRIVVMRPSCTSPLCGPETQQTPSGLSAADLSGAGDGGRTRDLLLGKYFELSAVRPRSAGSPQCVHLYAPRSPLRRTLPWGLSQPLMTRPSQG